MLSSFNALVIGYGSIGKRHAEVLKKLDVKVGLLTSKQVDGFVCYSELAQINVDEFDYVVIANPTYCHYKTIEKLSLANFTGTVLVEKPLLFNQAVIPKNNFKALYVGYNLRFNPLLQKLKKDIAGQKILSVMSYVGQYLPTWRPGTNLKDCHSAYKNKGGDVIYELSHEFDFLIWLFGKAKKVVSVAGKFSSLPIDSDDICSMLFVTDKNTVINLQLNYLDRICQRCLTVNTDEHSYHLDLVNGIFNTDGKIQKITYDRNDAFKAMHESILLDKDVIVCTEEDGLDIMSFIKKAELSSKQNKWIKA